jgi:hypothetical protein
VDAEMVSGRRLRPVDAVAPLDDVQVDLQDPMLPPYELEQEGEVRLEALPDPASALPEEHVPGTLHRDRPRAVQVAAAMASVVGERATDGGDVDPAMEEEACVLCRDDRAEKRGVHLVERHPALRDPAARRLDEAGDHQRRERRIEEAIEDDRARRDEHERDGNPGRPGDEPASHMWRRQTARMR